MKNFLILLYMSVIAGLAYIFPGKDADEAPAKQVKAAAVAPAAKPVHPKPATATTAPNTQPAAATFTDDSKEFIIAAAQSRMMDFAQGKAAKQLSETSEVKKYADRMMADQSTMLKALRSLAAKKGVDLPDDVGEKKSDALADLKDKKGEAFDKKFIKMMTIDHRRDVRQFKQAIDSDDPEVKEFAVRYLPMVEGHLQAIKEVKRAL